MIDIIKPKSQGIKRFSGATILPNLENVLPFSQMDKHGMVMHDGVSQVTAPTFVIDSGIVTYITGLNESGPEVNSIKDEKLKAEKIQEIRAFIKLCEEKIAGNYSISDEDLNNKTEFYSKVTTFKSVFKEEYSQDENGIRRISPRYWDKLTLTLRNEGYYLNINNIEDRLRLYIIEAGGYGLVAPSLEKAKGSGYTFYLDKVEDTAKEEAKDFIDRDKAGASLAIMYEKDQNKLFYITKLISAYPLQWKKTLDGSVPALMYRECTNYLNGEGIQKSKKEAIKYFNELCKQDIDALKLKCMVSDGFKNGALSIDSTGSITFTPTNTNLGKGESNVLAFLNAGGENEPIYQQLLTQCEQYWN